MQLEFQLEDITDTDAKIGYLNKAIVEVKLRSENVRKGLFARHNELAKMYLKQQEEIDELKACLQKMTETKECWIYEKNERLFELKTHTM